MARKTVVIGGLPRLLRELIRAELEADARLVVVGESESAAAAERIVAETHAEVLVLGVAGEPDRGGVCRLLQQWPELRVIAVVDDGRSAQRLELVVTEVEPVPSAIRAAILSRAD